MEGEIPSWSDNEIYLVKKLSNKVELPETFCINKVYPNPFNPTTTVHFDIPIESNIELIVYDTRGRIVETILKGLSKPGKYDVMWNANNKASGIYFITLVTENNKYTQKVILLK